MRAGRMSPVESGICPFLRVYATDASEREEKVREVDKR